MSGQPARAARSPRCARPGCTRAAQGTRDGLCPPHHRAAAPRRVPAARAIAHIRECLIAGASMRQIARAAGLSSSAHVHYLLGTAERITQTHERRILAVPVSALLPGDVPAWPVARRVRALRAAGWTLDELVAATGVDTLTLTDLSMDRRMAVRTSTDETIRRLYRQVEHQPVRPASARVRAMGWPRPADFDDIDTPPAPSMAADEDGRIPLTVAHHRIIADLRAHHGSIHAVARAAGVPDRTLGYVLHSDTVREQTAGRDLLAALVDAWLTLRRTTCTRDEVSTGDAA